MKRTKMACFGMLLGVFFLTGMVSVSANLQAMLKAGVKEVAEVVCKQRAKELVRIYIKAGGDLSREALERAARESVERARWEMLNGVPQAKLYKLLLKEQIRNRILPRMPFRTAVCAAPLP